MDKYLSFLTFLEIRYWKEDTCNGIDAYIRWNRASNQNLALFFAVSSNPLFWHIIWASWSKLLEKHRKWHRSHILHVLINRSRNAWPYWSRSGNQKCSRSNIVPQELKNGIEIIVGQGFLELLTKKHKILLQCFSEFSDNSLQNT